MNFYHVLHHILKIAVCVPVHSSILTNFPHTVWHILGGIYWTKANDHVYKDNDLTGMMIWRATLFHHPVICDHFLSKIDESWKSVGILYMHTRNIHPHFVFHIRCYVFAHFGSGILYLQTIMSGRMGWDGIQTDTCQTALTPIAHGLFWTPSF